MIESCARAVLQDYEIFYPVPMTPRIDSWYGGRVSWEKSTQVLFASIRILWRSSKSAYCKGGDETCAHDFQQDEHVATINTRTRVCKGTIHKYVLGKRKGKDTLFKSEITQRAISA